MRFSSIDIFCRVIDNYGDVGVTYRFAKECKLARPECRLRVFIDDMHPLLDMAPGFDPTKTVQEIDGIVFYAWDTITESLIERIGTGDILVEAFACYIPDAVLDVAARRPTIIINLEYFSAEKWIEGYHLKESLMGRGELKKYFFMPGLTKESGGVIIDTRMELARARRIHDRMFFFRELLEQNNLRLSQGATPLFGTVFTYMRGFDTLLEDVQTVNNEIYLFVFGKKSAEGMLRTLERKKTEMLNSRFSHYGNAHIILMPFLSQQYYDELLCACDFNIVRGEDSLVRAVLTGKPLLWQAYIQDNNYQLVKVKAFIENFRQYVDDDEVFGHYRETLMQFNTLQSEEPFQTTSERYDRFFQDLNKIERATGKMSYFIRENCNLVKNFLLFLNSL
jgi:uncharacterized repeat protein (TIGR03837 family)